MTQGENVTKAKHLELLNMLRIQSDALIDGIILTVRS